MTCKFVIADQNAVSVEGHFQTYTHELACAAQALGCETVVFWNRRFPLAKLRASYRMQGVFTSTEAEAAARNILPYGQGHFGFELERALEPLALGARDHVVIHTCHYVELAEALDYLALLAPIPDLPTFHIVVRYDPDVYRYRMSRLMRRLGAIQRTPHLREKLRLHSDTQQLATEFARLFSLPVGVCPIPVDLGGLLPAVRNAADLARVRPLIASYLGPARSEKGYRDILDAIDFLRKDYIDTDRLHFVLQCSERSIRAEAGLADYQQKLESYIREHGLEQKIRLVEHVVDQEEYCALVAQSDIALMAYSPVSYRYRSSSVLMEAMATGKVIVTRLGSWMASRVGPDNAVCFAEPAGLGPALAEAVTRFDELNAGAKSRQPGAIESGASATLARYFLESGAPAPERKSGPAILMIVAGDDLARGALGAALFLHRLSTCEQAGFRVHVALQGSHEADDFEARRRLADALRPHGLESLSDLSRGDIAALHVGDGPEAIYLAEGIDKDIVDGLGLAGSPLLQDATPSGALPFPFEPAQLEDLAGPVDGFELVASCDPLEKDFGLDNSPFIVTRRRYERLAALESVDILLHATEAADVRRFFEEVYRPFLAGRGMTTLVAGDIETGIDCGDFILVGHVVNRAPLYAAAKIVVTTGGRLAPLAMAESLSKGKPTLAFGAATGSGVKGLEAYEDASAIAQAIIELLGSSERRAEAAKQARLMARRVGAGETGAAFDAVFRALNPAASPIMTQPATPASDQTERVEWSATIRAANRFVRSVLADEPLDGVGELAGADDAGLELVSRIAKALVDEDRAPFLRIDGGLQDMALRRRARSGAAEITAILQVACDAAAPANDSRQTSSFILNRFFPTTIILAGVSGTNASPPRTTAPAIVQTLEDGSGNAFWRLRPEESEGAELALIDVMDAAAAYKIEVTQEIPLTPEATAFGRNIFVGWSFDHGPLMVLEKAPSDTSPSRLLERLDSGLQSFLSGWSPWATANPLFDEKWYVTAYPEISTNGLEAFRHYERYGARKGYRPNPFFDADWYARRYGTSTAAAWRHYLKRAREPQRDPSPSFSASRYLVRNRDVAANWPWGALLHYKLLGRGEGRSIYPAEPSRAHQSLALPIVIGRGGDAWVEVSLAGVAPIALHVGERKLDTDSHTDGGSTRVRAFLPRELAATGLVYVSVTLEPGAQPVEIRALRTGWTSGT